MRGYRVVLAAVAVAAAALLLAGAGALGFSPQAVSGTWVVSGGSAGGGVVNAVATAGSTAYVGGNFSYMGPATGSAAAFDTSSATPTPAWPAITGSVYTIVSDGTYWYVGGDFSSIGSAHYDNLVRIKMSDGTIDTAWQASTNGPVYTLLLSGGTLYAGGAFTTANGSARLRLASFTASTGALVASFHPDVTGPSAFVWSMDTFNSRIYFGGSFTQVNGTARTNAAAVLTTNGSTDAWDPGVNGTVYAVAITGSTIYLGGAFTHVTGNQTRNGLAAFASNGVPLSWNPSPNLNQQTQLGQVFSLAITGAPAVIYVGGSFTTIGGQTRPGLAAISSSSGLADPTFNAGFTAGATAVYHLAIPVDGNIYAGGFFQLGNTIGAADAKDNLVQLAIATGAPTAWHPVVGGSAYALAVNGTKVAVGGQFRTVGTQVVRRNNLGAIDLSTGTATSWSPYADNTVRALAISGSSVYAGGLFRNVTDTAHPTAVFPRHALAAFDVSSGALTSWDAELDDGEVYALAVSGSTIYAGGTFSTVFDPNAGGFVTRNRLASFDTGGLVTGWNPNVDNEVLALAVSGGSVFAGGAFTTVNGGTTRNRIAEFDASGNATAFNPNVNGDVNALGVSGTTVYAGGSFTQVNNNSVTRWGAAAFDASPGGGGGLRGTTVAATGDATLWNPHLEKLSGGIAVNGAVNALAIAGTLVYLGGDFDYLGSCAAVACQGTAGAVNAATGALASAWLPEPNAEVNAIALGQDGVVLGGPFTATGYPRPGGTYGATEANAAAHAGIALVRGLPEPPANVTAAPLNGAATITFGPSPYNGGASITQYTVTVAPGGQTVTGTSSPIQVNGLTNGQSYSFTVAATNSAGQGQQSSQSNTVTPTPPPGAPGKPTNVAGTPGDGQVSVSFTPPSDGGSPITQYAVAVSPGNQIVTGSSSPIVVTGLTNGTAYTFTVTASNAIGPGPTSDPSAPVTPRGLPGAPTNVVAAPGDSQATVTFDAAFANGAAISSYTVTSSPGSFTATGSGSPLIVTGLSNGQSYTFTVRATNAVGAGSASAPSNAVTPRTVPGAPTGVSATPGNAQALVSFTPPSDNGGSQVTGYVVTSSPGSFTAAGANSPVVIGGLTNGITYTFTVKATNAAGNGSPSGPSNAVTPRTVPGKPTGVTAVPGDGQATVSYTPPSDDGGSAITGYTVTSSPDGKTGTSTNGSPVVIIGLTNGRSYVFTVTASNAAGPGLASDTSAPVTPRTVPGTPTGVSASPGNGQATVSYTPPQDDGGSPITLYTATSSPQGKTGTSTDGTPITVTGLTNGVSYTFTVKATNVAGQGGASGASNAVTPAPAATRPDPPTGVSAVAGNAQATVTFSPPANDGGASIAHYTVTSSPGNHTGTGSASPITVAGLSNGTAYSFTVTATNSAGTSDPSTASNQVTPAGTTAPGAPTGVGATPGNGQATVTFTPPSDGGSPVIDYTVTSSPGGKTATGQGAPLTVTGLTNGQSYTFTVTARNAIGTSIASAPSSPVTPTFVAVAPDPPTGVAGTAGIGSVLVSFTPPVVDGGAAITSYTVTVVETGVTVNGPGSPILVTGLTNGTAYTFKVRATNSAGTSALSGASPPVTPALPARTGTAPPPPAETPRPDLPAPPPPSTRVPPPPR